MNTLKIQFMPCNCFAIIYEFVFYTYRPLQDFLYELAMTTPSTVTPSTSTSTKSNDKITSSTSRQQQVERSTELVQSSYQVADIVGSRPTSADLVADEFTNRLLVISSADTQTVASFDELMYYGDDNDNGEDYLEVKIQTEEELEYLSFGAQVYSSNDSGGGKRLLK